MIAMTRFDNVADPTRVGIEKLRTSKLFTIQSTSLCQRCLSVPDNGRDASCLYDPRPETFIEANLSRCCKTNGCIGFISQRSIPDCRLQTPISFIVTDLYRTSP